MSAEPIAGILKRINRNQFSVRQSERSYRPGQIEIMVSNSLTQHYRLAEGASIIGHLERIDSYRVYTPPALRDRVARAFDDRI